MRISAVVPARNAAAYLPQAVESLIATHQADLEIVIVDDGSTDATLEVARSLAARHPNMVTVFAQPRQRGVSAARNVGVEHSTGEAVCFLDADDYVFPHRFINATRILSANPAIDGVYELAELRYETAEAKLEWSGSGEIFGLSEPLRGTDLLTALVGQRVWHTSAVVVRRAALEQAGSFHEGLRIAEDCHLWFRLAAVANLAPGDLVQPVSVYRRHRTNTFRPGCDNHVPMVRAVADAYRWARANGAPADRLGAFGAAARTYVRRAMLASVDAGRPGVTWRVLASAVAGGLISPLGDPETTARALWTAVRATFRSPRATPSHLPPEGGR